MLTPRLPYPPDRGDTVRSWTALSGLARRHEVWLATLTQGRPQPDHLARVRDCCRTVAVFERSRLRSLCHGTLSLLAGHSLSAAYFHDARLIATVRHWSETVPFDAVLTYSSALAPAAEAIAARRRVLDMCDVDSSKWLTYARQSLPPLRWLYVLEGRRVAALEAYVARSHDVCLLVNERERRKLATAVPAALTDVVPTTVTPSGSALPDAALATPPSPIIGMVGSMFYPPNVRAVNWFGRNVWPLVRARLPRARWLIVGSRPTRSVRRWRHQPGVEVTGYVPDVQPYLAQMRVFVNPVVGNLGVQSKVVVAMAAGRACVVTSDTAAGLTYNGPAPLLIADQPDEFAAAVVRIATDAELWQSLSRRARTVAHASYRAETQVDCVERWLAGMPPAATENRPRVHELPPRPEPAPLAAEVLG
jgi:sugar transferase (PEP-CTERM/EpsH1 system associated)